jgi:hypothetical protein
MIDALRTRTNRVRLSYTVLKRQSDPQQQGRLSERWVKSFNESIHSTRTSSLTSIAGCLPSWSRSTEFQPETLRTIVSVSLRDQILFTSDQ